jgi:hypothetical protein
MTHGESAIRGNVVLRALRGEEHFYSSAVASATGFSTALVAETLSSMVDEGLLAFVLTLSAPCGKVIEEFEMGEALPFGEARKCSCLRCRFKRSFTVTSKDLYVAHRPERDFLLAILRERHYYKDRFASYQLQAS